LYGKPVPGNINGKEPFILLQATDSSYAASGGCNGLGGKFTLQERGRITFSQGMSTMMACEDMWVENDLKKALENADNYTTGENPLSLTKARMAPLARFERAEQQEGPSAP